MSTPTLFTPIAQTVSPLQFLSLPTGLQWWAPNGMAAVLSYRDVVYVPLNGPNNAALVAFAPYSGRPFSTTQLPGIWNITSISIDLSKQTVTFSGANNATQSLPWAQLARIMPTVSVKPITSAPTNLATGWSVMPTSPGGNQYAALDYDGWTWLLITGATGSTPAIALVGANASGTVCLTNTISAQTWPGNVCSGITVDTQANTFMVNGSGHSMGPLPCDSLVFSFTLPVSAQPVPCPPPPANPTLPWPIPPGTKLTPDDTAHFYVLHVGPLIVNPLSYADNSNALGVFSVLWNNQSPLVSAQPTPFNICRIPGPRYCTHVAYDPQHQTVTFTCQDGPLVLPLNSLLTNRPS